MSDKRLPAESATEAPYVDRWRRLWWLPCDLTVEIPLAHFTVRELLRMEPGSVVGSTWSRTAEVPVCANGQRIGWAEFEALTAHIGARITELL